jgi:Kdo2-lipid IVA lauroyltransferase/acyltransferase
MKGLIILSVLGIILTIMVTKSRWKLARILGCLWHAIDARHRVVAMHNLELAFKDELTEARRRSLCRHTFIHLACVFLELPHLVTLTKDNLDEFITFSGIENLATAAKRGKGVLVMASHFGNWELMSLAFSLRYRPFNVVARPLDNPLLDRLIHRIRSRGGNQILPKRGSARSIRRLLHQGEAVALLIDQNANWREGVYVPFFKEIACTNKALAALALRTGAPIVPVYNHRLADGRYEMVFEPEVQLIRSGDMTSDVEENTALFNTIIERYVRLHPEQWLWVHRRWKSRPYRSWPRRPGRAQHRALSHCWIMVRKFLSWPSGT